MTLDNHQTTRLDETLTSANIDDQYGTLLVVLDDDNDDDDVIDDDDDNNDKKDSIDVKNSNVDILLQDLCASNPKIGSDPDGVTATETERPIVKNGQKLETNVEDQNVGAFNVLKPLTKSFRHGLESGKTVSNATRVNRSLAVSKILLKSKCRQQRIKAAIKSKTTPEILSSQNHKDFSIDSKSLDNSISLISFDKIADILAIMRMGSVYYCVEDLYEKVFSRLCKFSEFLYLLEKTDKNILKKATLCESMAINQRNPTLKQHNYTVYHLITMNASSCLLKLKQFLTKFERVPESTIDDSFCELSTKQSNKISPLSMQSNQHIPMNNKNSYSLMTTCISKSPDFVQLTQYPRSTHHENSNHVTNETLPPTSNLSIYTDTTSESSTTRPLNNNDEFRFTENSNNSFKPCLASPEANNSLKRRILNSFNPNVNSSTNSNDSTSIISKSNLRSTLNYPNSLLSAKPTAMYTAALRAYRFPSNELNEEDNEHFQSNSEKPERVELSNDSNSMPLIVDVEENVQINNSNVQHSGPVLSHSQISSMNTGMPSMPNTQQIPNNCVHPYQSFSLTTNSTSISTPYHSSFQQISTHSVLYGKSQEVAFHQQTAQTKPLPPPNNGYFLINPNVPSSPNRSSVHIFNNHQTIPADRSTVTTPNQAPCLCCPQLTAKSSMSDAPIPKGAVIDYRLKSSPSDEKQPSLEARKSSNPLLALYRQQRRVALDPYQTKKPVSSTAMSNNYPKHPSETQSPNKANVYQSVAPCVVQNCATVMSPPNTPNGSALPSTSANNISLAQVIRERGVIDVDTIPKLVVRHTKVYPNKQIDVVGQLFPTWFTAPDYRCLHCFTCDLVFSPQQFMLHVDDNNLKNLPPLNMTPIQLLTSEKLSEYKVKLWNEFCANLAEHVRMGQLIEFSTIRNF